MGGNAVRRWGVFVTGTDTGVGKTAVAAGLAALAERRLRERGPAEPAAGAVSPPAAPEVPRAVRLWKPAQSGAAPGAADADSRRLQRASGLAQEEADIASYTLEAPLAPWIAARLAGGGIDYPRLVREGRERLARGDFLLAEGAGGLAVPLTAERLVADLARDLALPLLIVARPGLGTVNHTVLTAAYARQFGLDVAGVILNGVRPDMEPARLAENREMIERFGGVRVWGALPWLPEPDAAADDRAWERWREQWLGLWRAHAETDGLLDRLGI